MGAREDSWPLENVSKVSVITGEFNGHSVSGLIHYCWTYFFITMGFDLLQAFVVENIQVSHARPHTHTRERTQRAQLTRWRSWQRARTAVHCSMPGAVGCR